MSDIVLAKSEALELDLPGAPTTPWSYNITYERRGQVDGGAKSASGTIPSGTTVVAIAAPDGFAFRQAEISVLQVTNLDSAAQILKIQKNDGVTPVVLFQQLVGPGQTVSWNGTAFVAGAAGVNRLSKDISLAEIVALGASMTGTIDIPGLLPAGAMIQRAVVKNNGDAEGTLTTLTALIETDADDQISAAADVKTADGFGAGPVDGTDLKGPFDVTAGTQLRVQLDSTGSNLAAATGLAAGLTVEVDYVV